jgi:hypothetical protein
MSDRKPLEYITVPHNQFYLAINGRECRWLSRVLGRILGPFMDWLDRRRMRHGLVSRCISALPNQRVKLAAPGVWGRIPFVSIHVWRRSLRAAR